MLRNNLLLFVDFGLHYVPINCWCCSWGSLGNVTRGVAACSACASIVLGVINAVALMRLLRWSVLKTTIATIMRGHAFSLIIYIYGVWFTIDWLLLIMVSILVGHVCDSLEVVCGTVSAIAPMVICSLSVIWPLIISTWTNSIPFPLRTTSHSQNWIARWTSNICCYDLRWIRTRVPSGIMTRPPLWTSCNLLWSWLIIIGGSNIVWRLRIS